MKRSIVAILSVLIMGCSSQLKVSSSADNVGDLSGFHRVENFQQFESAYIKAPEDFDAFSYVMYEPLDIDSLEIDTSRIERDRGSWTLKADDKKLAARLFADQVNRYYQAPRRFGLSGQSGKGVLRVNVELVKFIPSAPRDSFKDRQLDTDYYTEGAGKLFMRARIYDAVSGEMMALLEDERELGWEWRKNDRVNNVRRFNDGLRTWIARIDSGLGLLKQL